MKRHLVLSLLAVTAAGSLVSCNNTPPPRTTVHHYHTTTRTRYVPSYNYWEKPAGVSGGSTSGGYASPEGFQAVTPPATYSY